MRTYRTTCIKNLDSIELGLLGNAVGLRSNCTSAVGSVTIAVGVGAITSKVGEESSTTLELGVGGGDTSVYNIDTRALTSTVVVGVGQSAGLAVLVRNAREPPSGTALGYVGPLREAVDLTKVGLDNSILLDILNL